MGAKMGIAIEEGFASTVFCRMQDNARLISSALSTPSHLFGMLPAPSFSPNPGDHNEDVQGLLDAVQFPLASSSSAHDTVQFPPASSSPHDTMQNPLPASSSPHDTMQNPLPATPSSPDAGLFGML